MNILTTKPIMIVSAALTLSVVPEQSYAAREWLWGGGRFRPVPIQRQVEQPSPVFTRDRNRQTTRRTTERTPLVSRRVREKVSTRFQQPQRSNDTSPSIENKQILLERRELERQRADLQKQQAVLERGKAVLAKGQEALQLERAKLGRQTGTGVPSTDTASITCDAARAVVADFGFQEVKPELCRGKTMRFGATRDGAKFSIEVAASGELTKVRRLP